MNKSSEVNNKRKERRRARRAAGLCECGRERVEGYKTCQKHRAERLKRGYRHEDLLEQKARYARCKAAVFAAYGNECVCCGEFEPMFLEIDHIYGGGGRHRTALQKGGITFYRWLEKMNFPPEFRILCANCNKGRFRNGGMCPHELREIMFDSITSCNERIN